MLQPNMTDYDFLKLLIANMVIQDYHKFIAKEELEKKLYRYSKDLKYMPLFKNITGYEGIDYNFIDLDRAFKKAYASGLLREICDMNETRVAINITKKNACQIYQQFQKEEQLAMSNLCAEICDAMRKENFYAPEADIKKYN